MPPRRRPLTVCPSCGHPVGWRRRLLNLGLLSVWNCASCGTRLRFGVLRRAILIPLVLFLIRAYVEPYVDLWIYILTLGLGLSLVSIADPVVEISAGEETNERGSSGE